eukprot:749274-Hanusia_phi.AAC.5
MQSETRMTSDGAQSLTRGSFPTPSSRPSRWSGWRFEGSELKSRQLAEEMEVIWAEEDKEVLVTSSNAKVLSRSQSDVCDVCSLETKCKSLVSAEQMHTLPRYKKHSICSMPLNIVCSI